MKNWCLWQGFPHSSAFQRTGDFLSEKGLKFWILGSVSWWQRSDVFTGPQTQKSAATFLCSSWYFFGTEVHSLEPGDRALQCFWSAVFFCVLFESQLVLTVSLRHVMQFLSLGGFVQALHCGYCNCDDRTLAWFIQGESTEKFCFNEIWNIGRVHPINVAVSRQSESQVAIYWETARWRGKTLFSLWERWEGGSRIGLEIYWMFLQEWLIERVSSSAEA